MNGVILHRSVQEKMATKQSQLEFFRSVAWEAPFWIGFLIWCWLPTTRTPWFAIATIQMSSKDLLIIALTLLYAARALSLWLKKGQLRRIYRLSTGNEMPSSALYHLPITTGFMIAYLTVSVFWNGNGTRDNISMLFTLAVTAGSFYLAYFVLKTSTKEAVRRILWWMTIGLAAVSVIYTAQSVFNLGLRNDDVASEFGIERVKGPLFASSTGFFVLLPALAFAVQEFTRERKGRLFKLAIIFVLFLVMIGLGSRGSLVVLGIFLCLLLLVLRGSQRIVIFLLCVVSVVAAGAFIYSRANTDRLRTLEDDNRAATHLIVLELIPNRPLLTNLLGSGYGSYWSWYLQETDFQGDIFTDYKVLYRGVLTPYGRMLYHPHSVMLLLVLEGGLVGTLYFLMLWSVLGWSLLKGIRGAPFAIASAGMVASAFGMFFDTFIFKSSAINVIWWVFLLGTLTLNYQPFIPKARQPQDFCGQMEFSEASPNTGDLNRYASPINNSLAV